MHQQLVYEELIGNSVKCLTDVQVYNIHGFSLIHQASDFLIEVYQFGQALLTLGEAMLTTAADFSVLNMPGNVFQN